MANYSCKKFSPTPYALVRVHSLQMNGQTDRWTVDNHDVGSTLSLQFSCQPKNCYK